MRAFRRVYRGIVDPTSLYIENLMRTAVPEIKYDFEQANRATVGNLTPESRLMMAVLLDAVEIVNGRRMPGFYGTSRSKGDPCREARRWIARNDNDSIFSFTSICERFGLDPEAVRAEVLGKKRAA